MYVFWGYLEGPETEETNADGPVGGVLNSWRLRTKLKTSCPTSNPNDVGRGLASNMKVKPCRVG